jgi:hypothetical protein
MPTLIWSNLAIDFIEALPHVNKTMILTMVDRLSKAAHFIPMGRPYTSTSMAQPFGGASRWASVFHRQQS